MTTVALDERRRAGLVRELAEGFAIRFRRLRRSSDVYVMRYADTPPVRGTLSEILGHVLFMMHECLDPEEVPRALMQRVQEAWGGRLPPAEYLCTVDDEEEQPA